jgi:penicillin-binding protein 2
VIKDRRGRVLVDNRPSFDVYLTPAYCKGKEREEVMSRLATYLNMPPEDVDRMRREYARAQAAPREDLETSKPYLVELDIPRDQVDVLEAHRNELSCVDLIPAPHRNYRYGVGLGHVLGYMSEVTPEEVEAHEDYRRGQTVGRRGIERRWEAVLRGKEGKEAVAVDAKGHRLDEQMNEILIPPEERFVAPKPGDNLVLSLDARLQEEADKAFPGRAGGVLVMEAKTGFILAMVSRPSFDPNQMSGRISRPEMARLFSDPLKPMINRVMNENYHPGSTFKVVTSLAALEKGAVTAGAGISCGGSYHIGSHRWRCDKPTGHGLLTLKTALQYSCDVYYYTLGDRLGIEPLSEMAHKLGYGQPTGLDLGREIPGVIPDTQTIIKGEGAYTRGHAVNASIGQGWVNVTPLQQAVAYAAIGNGGMVLRPQILRRIETPDGKVIKQFPPQILSRLDVKPAHLAAVQAGLLAVVNEPGGTAYRSRLPDVRYAGKTGTAQVMALGGKQKLDPATQAYLSRDHAWFAAYAPAVDPEIVVVVLNEHGGWGAEAAAPAASKIIDAYFRIKREEQGEIAQVEPTLPPVVVGRTPAARVPAVAVQAASAVGVPQFAPGGAQQRTALRRAAQIQQPQQVSKIPAAEPPVLETKDLEAPAGDELEEEEALVAEVAGPPAPAASAAAKAADTPQVAAQPAGLAAAPATAAAAASAAAQAVAEPPAPPREEPKAESTPQVAKPLPASAPAPSVDAPPTSAAPPPPSVAAPAPGDASAPAGAAPPGETR